MKELDLNAGMCECKKRRKNEHLPDRTAKRMKVPFFFFFFSAIHFSHIHTPFCSGIVWYVS